MLEIVDLRSDTLEFSDHDINSRRDRLFLIYRITIILPILLTLYISLSGILNGEKGTYYLLILLVWIISVPLIYYYREKLLPEDMKGFVIKFNQEKEVTELSVLLWKKGHINQLSQEMIRFNQAVGFKCLMTDSRRIEIIIIVHKDYPGDIIFQTYDFVTLAELKESFAIIFPDYDEWYYITEDNDQWDDEDIEDIEEELKLKRVPSILREFFPITHQQ